VDAAERDATLRAGVELFDAGRYLAAHELFEELWESTEGYEADFFKGLIQAAIALHHFQAGNLEGAAKLYSGHRRFLSPFQPVHAGLDVARFLREMQAFLQPVLDRLDGGAVPFPLEGRPRLLPRAESETGTG
jgi:hypothetical protein